MMQSGEWPKQRHASGPRFHSASNIRMLVPIRPLRHTHTHTRCAHWASHAPNPRSCRARAHASWEFEGRHRFHCFRCFSGVIRPGMLGVCGPRVVGSGQHRNFRGTLPYMEQPSSSARDSLASSQGLNMSSWPQRSENRETGLPSLARFPHEMILPRSLLLSSSAAARKSLPKYLGFGVTYPSYNPGTLPTRLPSTSPSCLSLLPPPRRAPARPHT